MPGQARQPDICTGHGCFPPRPPSSWSDNVIVNGLNALRQFDSYAAHGCATCPAHGGSVAVGSSTVYINDRKAARIGDMVDCGSAIAVGSTTVFVGG